MGPAHSRASFATPIAEARDTTDNQTNRADARQCKSGESSSYSSLTTELQGLPLNTG